jgi:hypothetical protein
MLKPYQKNGIMQVSFAISKSLEKLMFRFLAKPRPLQVGTRIVDRRRAVHNAGMSRHPLSLSAPASTDFSVFPWSRLFFAPSHRPVLSISHFPGEGTSDFHVISRAWQKRPIILPVL